MIMEFQERLPDEVACLEYLAASRWPEGYRCPAYGGQKRLGARAPPPQGVHPLPSPDLGHWDGDALNPHSA